MGNEWKQNSPIAIMTVCSCNSKYYWSMNEGSDFILHKICFAAVLMQSSLCFQGKWTLLIPVLKVSSCAAAVAVVMRRGKVFWPAAAVTSYNTVTSVSGTTFTPNCWKMSFKFYIIHKSGNHLFGKLLVWEGFKKRKIVDISTRGLTPFQTWSTGLLL